MLEPMCVVVHALRLMNLIRTDAKTECDRDAAIGSSGGIKYQSIAVCGLGTIGLLVALFLKDAGYQNVFCIGNKDIQRKKMLDMGYESGQIIDIRDVDAVAELQKRTGGRGADVYFECIGRSENYEQAVSCVAPFGQIMLVGNPASDMSLPRNKYWKILRNQLTLRGTWNSSFYGIDGIGRKMNSNLEFLSRDNFRGSSHIIILSPWWLTRIDFKKLWRVVEEIKSCGELWKKTKVVESCGSKKSIHAPIYFITPILYISSLYAFSKSALWRTPKQLI